MKLSEERKERLNKQWYDLQREYMWNPTMYTAVRMNRISKITGIKPLNPMDFLTDEEKEQLAKELFKSAKKWTERRPTAEEFVANMLEAWKSLKIALPELSKEEGEKS